MSENKRKVEVSLYDSHLHTSAGESIGRVHSAGTINNQGIASLIKKEGSEYQTEAIVEILNRADRIRSQALAEGYAIHTDFVHARLSVKGTFTEHTFDPAKQSLSVVINPTATVREAIKDLPVEVLGKANVSPVIIKVTDSLTGEVNATITPNNALTITGDKILIGGDHADVGVHFINVKDSSKIKADQIISNKNKELIVMTPALATGDYQLEVITQINGSKDHILKEPRNEKLEAILTVK